MISALLTMALAPVMICLIYVYVRDKYEKEPTGLLTIGVIYGIIITVPIILTENFVTIFIPNAGIMAEVFYLSFIVAALVEESFKYVILFFLVWRNDNFNERFDGIVYAVFISLGFAGLENILYVLNPELGGFKTAAVRAVFSVPGHAFFGVAMGYYFALSKFEPAKKSGHRIMAFFAPWFLHGAYNFILMSNKKILMALFVPFVGFLWISGFRNMKRHIDNSPFKYTVEKKW